MQSNRLDSIYTRGIDLSLPSNRFAVFFPIAVTLTAFILNYAGYLPQTAIIYLPLLSFVTWVLARELAPDYPGVALSASIATLGIAIFLQPLIFSMPLLVGLIFIFRLLQGTKKQTISNADIIIFSIVQTAIILYSKEQILAIPSLIAIFSLLHPRIAHLSKAKTIVLGAIPITAAALYTAASFNYNLDIEDVPILLLIGTSYSFTQILNCRVVSKCDNGQSFSLDRIKLARAIALGWLLFNLGDHGLKSLNVLPLLACMLIAPIYEQIKLGLPVHQSQTET